MFLFLMIKPFYTGFSGSWWNLTEIKLRRKDGDKFLLNEKSQTLGHWKIVLLVFWPPSRPVYKKKKKKKRKENVSSILESMKERFIVP